MTLKFRPRPVCNEIVFVASIFLGLLAPLGADEAKEKVSPIVSFAIERNAVAPSNFSLRANADVKSTLNLAYIYFIPFGEDEIPADWQHIIVFRRSTGEFVINKLRVRSPFWAFAPQISPDGQKVLFKIGDPFASESPFGFFIWDVASNEIIAGPKINLYVRSLTWSPDSRSVAYFKQDSNGKSDVVILFSFSVKDASFKKLIEDVLPYLKWSNPNEILFTKTQKQNNSKIETSVIQKFSIPQMRTLGLGFQGYDPLVSPNGRNVIFSRNEAVNESSNTYITKYFSLNDNKEKPLSWKLVTNSQYTWSFNSKRLVFLKRMSSNESRIYQADIESGDSVSSLSVTAFNRKKSPVSPSFQLIPQVSSDNMAYIITSEHGERFVNSPLIHGFNIVSAADIDRKKVTPMFEIADATGIDVRPTEDSMKYKS